MRRKSKYITDCKDRLYHGCGNTNTERLVYTNMQIYLNACITHIFSSTAFTLLCVLNFILKHIFLICKQFAAIKNNLNHIFFVLPKLKIL